jgi:hypothetical protein
MYKTEAPAAYLATGELPSAYIAGTSQWSLLLGATDSTGRPIYNAYNPQNNGGVAGPQSLRGNVMGLDLYVDPNAVPQPLMSRHSLSHHQQLQSTKPSLAHVNQRGHSGRNRNNALRLPSQWAFWLPVEFVALT